MDLVWFYIVIVLLCRVVQALFSKRTSLCIQNFSMAIGYSALESTFAAILGLGLILFSGKGFRIDLPTVLIAVFFGLMLLGSSFCSIYGMKSGTITLTSMAGTAGIIIPLLAGIFLFSHPILPIQWLGVALFFVSAWLLSNSSKQTYPNFTFSTVLILIGNLIFNGCTSLAQQMFTYYVPDGDVSSFSLIAFGTVAIVGWIVLPFMKHHIQKHAPTAPSTQDQPTVSTNKTLTRDLVICAIALSAAVFIVNQLVTISTALISPVILFTFTGGGGTIVITLVATIAYREKLSFTSISGVVIGIAAMILTQLA